MRSVAKRSLHEQLRLRVAAGSGMLMIRITPFTEIQPMRIRKSRKQGQTPGLEPGLQARILGLGATVAGDGLAMLTADRNAVSESLARTTKARKVTPGMLLSLGRAIERMFADEENFLFPALRSRGGSYGEVMVDECLDGHEAVLGKLDALRFQDFDTIRPEGLLDLRRHIERVLEHEALVLEHAARWLGAEERQRIGACITRRHAELASRETAH